MFKLGKCLEIILEIYSTNQFFHKPFDISLLITTIKDVDFKFNIILKRLPF